MAKLKPVTEAELAACIGVTDQAVVDMQEMTHRIRGSAFERIDVEHAAKHARNFALIARAAADISHALLSALQMQMQRDELDRLKAEAGG